MSPDETARRLLDDAISAYVGDGKVVVGWTLMVAVHIQGSEDGATTHVYEVPLGQPVYATLGILEVGRAQIREDSGVTGGSAMDDGD